VKKFIIPLMIVALCLVSMPVALVSSSAEGDVSIPDDTPVSYGYLLGEFKEQLKKELIAELAQEGGITIDTLYQDISASEGQLILLSEECEVIYRGGGAVAISSSDKDNEGITDMSKGTELFSGEPLEYGHIYFASATDSKKAILVTGDKAYFTVRGDYDIG
jgi:hypothetical protein